MKRRIASLGLLLAVLAIVMAVLPAQAQQQAAPSGDANGRIARLEQRILDMQTVIATLQSMVQNGAAAPAQGGVPQTGGAPAGGGPSELSIRVLALETQVRALTGQLEQITARLDQLATQPGAGAPMQQGQAAPQQDQQPGGGPPPFPAPQGQAQGAHEPASPQQAAPQFGTTLSQPAPATPYPRTPQTAPQPPSTQGQTASLPPLTGLSGGGARAMYDASYQSFLRNEYQAAEQGFRTFVETYPDDRLTSNAYYWLGRTHFARNQFEPAAKAFLAGYKKDKKSAVAPDSLLHLGLSLAQMGETDAACSTLKAVARQFPDAPDELKQNVAAARKRSGC